jgi:hypothetical protein
VRFFDCPKRFNRGVETGGIHPPTCHRYTTHVTFFKEVNVGDRWQKIRGARALSIFSRITPFFYYSAPNKTTHNHHNSRLLLSQTHPV